MAYPFIGARHYTRLNSRHVDIVVVHTMENQEKPDSAENVARWFAGSTSPKASAHYCVDSNGVVQCVREQDVAWCAPGANHDGIHIEHAGRAGQTAADWSDEYSQAMLRLSAKLAAGICRRHDIPVRWLVHTDVQNGRRGITSHANVSLAFGKSDHWDPGPNFPVEQYLSLIRAHMVVKPPKPVPPPVPKPVPPADFYTWARWYRGHGEFKAHGPRNPKVRPNVPKNITRDRPLWWVRLALNKGAS